MPFDVPPPQDGVRGIEAYRETWPPFFEWQARGASVEIVSLDVTAGNDVAYAQALLRCGTPDAIFPPTRKARPPNIRCSVTPGSPATSSRIRLQVLVVGHGGIIVADLS